MTQGQRVANSIGARAYHETSALLNQGVDALFEAATRAAVLVRDQGHGGIGAAYDRDGMPMENGGGGQKSRHGERACCVIA